MKLYLRVKRIVFDFHMIEYHIDIVILTFHEFSLLFSYWANTIDAVCVKKTKSRDNSLIVSKAIGIPEKEYTNVAIFPKYDISSSAEYPKNWI